MKKRLRSLLRLLILGIVIVIGIIVVKTMTFASKQIEVAPVQKVPIPVSNIQHLVQAIRLPTVSQEGLIDTMAFLQLDSLIQNNFPNVHSQLEKTRIHQFSLIYKWQGKHPDLPPVLLTAHMDVVPVEENSKKDWQALPFSGELRDGFIWGRGTLDDKISVFGILQSVENLLNDHYEPERTVYLAFGHDEEISGLNGAASIARWFQEKNIHFEYVLDEGALILEKALPGLEKPLAMIGIAEKGYTTLKLTVALPEGGHSSMPPKATAIGILSQAIAQLETHPFPAKLDGATRGMLTYIGPEMSQPFRTIFANLWLTESLLKREFAQQSASSAMIRTTTAPTIINGGTKDNVLPTLASAKVNFRILPGETIASVKNYVRETIADERVAVTQDSVAAGDNPSKVSGTNTFGFLVIQKSIKEIFPNTVVAPSLVIGATDGRHYQSVSDNVYRFLPMQINNEDLARLHGINERVSIENYQNAIRFYRQLILNSCK